MQGLIPGSGRSPGEENGYPLQYSCLENPVERGAGQTTVHGVTKESDMTKWLNNDKFHCTGEERIPTLGSCWWLNTWRSTVDRWCCSITKSHLTLCDLMDCSMVKVPCPSLCPRVFSNSCPLSWWCYLTISSSAVPFSFCLQSFSASRWVGSSYQVAKILDLQQKYWFLWWLRR